MFNNERKRGTCEKEARGRGGERKKNHMVKGDKRWGDGSVLFCFL